MQRPTGPQRLPVPRSIVVLFDREIRAEYAVEVRGEGLGVPTINGGEVVALQAAEQFALYTGVRPTPEQVEAAEAFANTD